MLIHQEKVKTMVHQPFKCLILLITLCLSRRMELCPGLKESSTYEIWSTRYVRCFVSLKMFALNFSLNNLLHTLGQQNQILLQDGPERPLWGKYDILFTA